MRLHSFLLLVFYSKTKFARDKHQRNLLPQRKPQGMQRQRQKFSRPRSIEGRIRRAIKEILWPFEARIFEFWQGFGDGEEHPLCGASPLLWRLPQRPATEPKRRQNSKRPLCLESFKWLQNFFNGSRIPFSNLRLLLLQRRFETVTACKFLPREYNQQNSQQ